MRNPKTTCVVVSLTAVACTAASLTFPFSVFAQSQAVPSMPSDIGRQSILAAPVVSSAVTPSASVPTKPAPLAVPVPAKPMLPAVMVSLADGSQAAKPVAIHGKTVKDALAEAHITLSNDDRVHPPLAAFVRPGLPIVITRIRFQLESRTSAIPFPTVFKMSRDVPAGRIQGGRTGVPGVQTSTYKVGYVNGQPHSFKLVSRAVTKAPIPQETLAGIRVREARALPSRGGVYNRMRCYTMTATGYSPYEGSSTGRCATGMRAGYGVVAVDPRLIRLGTRLYIEGYGYAVAGDTGGAIKGRRIDLGHTTYREASDVGRRQVRVWVLSPGR